MKTLRPPKSVIEDWIAELAQRLDRPVEEIRRDGLQCSDFSGDVEVRTPYGMKVRFSLAFFLVRPSAAEAVVFSEHSGYAEFDLVDEMVLAEISESFYRHDQDDFPT